MQDLRLGRCHVLRPRQREHGSSASAVRASQAMEQDVHAIPPGLLHGVEEPNHAPLLIRPIGDVIADVGHAMGDVRLSSFKKTGRLWLP